MVYMGNHKKLFVTHQKKKKKSQNLERDKPQKIMKDHDMQGYEGALYSTVKIFFFSPRAKREVLN